jgi:L-methionine (R)-S-oxide reductase
MAEELAILKGSKTEQYESLLPQIQSMLQAETDFIANLANISAALKQQFDWLWIGFYLIKGDELVLGPFQGPIACTRIRKGKGVCGTSWAEGRTLIVPDVEKFPGHIACSSLSKSEIVVPLFKGDKVIGVFDADSQSLNTYDEIDQHYLEKLAQMIVCTL